MNTVRILSIALVFTLTACGSDSGSGSPAPIQTSSRASIAACVPGAFFTPEPHAALLGYRCRDIYAVALTASAMDGELYGGRGQSLAVLYVSRAGAWVFAASSGGGVYISFSEVANAGLDPTTIARVLDLETSMDTLVISRLGCNGSQVTGACA